MARLSKPRQPVFLVAVDGSPESAKAADRAVELANKLGAQLLIVTVEDPRGLALPPTGPQRSDRRAAPTSAQIVEREWRRAKHEGVSASSAVLQALDPAEEIVRHAEAQGAEMIVVGSRGLTGIKRVLLGSVASKVVALAHCPVLVVR